MKRCIKSFMPDFRPAQGPDVSFELYDFLEEDFECHLCRGEDGIYIISSTDGSKYTYTDGRQNPILYIGKSDDLLRRLRDEYFTKGMKRLIDNPNFSIAGNIHLAPCYQNMYYNGAHVDIFKCRGNQESKNLESLFLKQFYQKYRGLLVGNGARSYDID